MATARPKRALLIGIDTYPHVQPLYGCVNDVQLMRQILVEGFGFPTGNVTLLLNGQATREAMLAAFDALVEQTGPDDIVVIHYSGHGSQMTDREGDEPSGLDSTVVPYDSGRGAFPNRDITDDEIHVRLERLARKTPYVTLIFDSCHSGTISRDAFGEVGRFVPPDLRPISELPPSPLTADQRAIARSADERGASGWLPLADRYVLIAGCRDDESSYETCATEAEGGARHGALTYFLARELRSGVPGLTYRDVHEHVAAQVTGIKPFQHPQLEGTAEREVFGIAEFEPMRFLRVDGRSGGTIRLAAGAALGVTVGSRYDVFPPGTKQTEGIEKLGAIEIDRVGALTADGHVLSESRPNAIAGGDRAVETEHDYGDLRLLVEVLGAPGLAAQADALQRRIRGSSLLRLAGAGEKAALRAYLLAPRANVGPGDPVPQLGALDSATCAVVRDDGQLAMRPREPGAVDVMVENLETIARYRHTLALDNAAPDSSLRGKFDLELLRRADGRWVVAVPDPRSGQIVFEEGEAIAFRVRSRHDKPAFVSLLDFGLSGAISVIYRAEKLAPGIAFDIGAEGDYTLEFPEIFPYCDDPVHGSIPEGAETIKLVVTTDQTDLAFLAQAGLQGTAEVRGPTSPLMQLWETAYLGASREVHGPNRLQSSAEDWTTVARPFLLRRARSAPLAADGQPVELGGAILTTPGLEGRAQLSFEGGRALAQELRAGPLVSALEAANVELRRTLEIEGAVESGPAVRSVDAQPAMEVSFGEPGPAYGQMALSVDELGVASWHFRPPTETVRATGAAGAALPIRRTYLVPRAVPAVAPEPGERGVIGLVGKKLVQELVFPLLDPVLGEVGEAFAGHWEAKYRPYRLRSFTPNDYTRPEGQAIERADWQQLAAGPALLLVHGTFSRAHTAFGAMPRELVETLHRRYEGRVFAFDHYTLSHDPRENVSWLLGQVPEDVQLDLDIICHSRGGLVSRVLAERQDQIGAGSRAIRLRRVIFVGAPNAGTILADHDQLGHLIDNFTNLLNFVPTGGLGDVLAGIVTVAKMLAVGAAGGLRGLDAMRPGGPFGKWLNAGGRVGAVHYYALASDYTPVMAGLREFAKDRVMDLIFKKPNDLVVPTEGVYGDNGSGFFPIRDRLVLKDAESVGHLDYFDKSAAARQKIIEWLT